MTPKAPNSKLSDPRIISPDIKVIYPSQGAEKDLSVSDQQTTPPTAQTLPTQTVPVTQTTKETVSTPPSSTAMQTVTETTTASAEPAKLSTWKETLKEHAQLFLVVALISVGIGILIGKKL